MNKEHRKAVKRRTFENSEPKPTTIATTLASSYTSTQTATISFAYLLLHITLYPISLYPQPPTRKPRLVQSSLLLLLRRLLLSTLLLVFHLYRVEVLDQIGDIVIIVIGGGTTSDGGLPLLALLDGLVGFGQFTEGGEGVGAELVEDAGDELGEFFHLAGTVDGEGVGGNCCMDCR